MSGYKTIIKKFSRQKVLVVGDIILDRYIRGGVSRISPEAPVPVVLEQDFSYQPGGAANVAHNLAVMGAHVTQVGRIGNDFEGQLLKRDLKRKGIGISGIFFDKNAPTITKTRVIAQNQQVVRIDREKTDAAFGRETRQRIKTFITKYVPECDGVIVSDYGKGMISPELVDLLREETGRAGIPLTVDPKVEHFGRYRGVTCITPNLKEAENAIRNIKIQESRGSKLALRSDKLNSMKDIEFAGEKLLDFLELDSLLITLGEQGMRLFEKGKTPFAIQTRARDVYDVTGAGDAVISVFTLALMAGADKRRAAELANYAAGVVVARMGAVAVTPEELFAATEE
ncbi:MAG: bifunctional heptose 7-phosphate kinase/heptose 1-phosphate adenyltransferase [Candidatus Omnitrophota bacterium]